MVPSGFQETVVFSGLTNPTVVRFATDGRVFVAEKSGLIKVFDNLLDPTPTIFADLRTNVHNFWDRGLLGMALDPNFPTDPYVYVLYTYDARSETAPRWSTVGAGHSTPARRRRADHGRLRRQRAPVTPQAAGNVMTGPEQVLIEDWCQQFPSHSIGDARRSAPTARSTRAPATARASTSSTTGQDGHTPRTRAAIRPVASERR